MNDLVLHPSTERALQFFIAKPSHALLLTGPAGIGKLSVASFVAASLLGVELPRLAAQPYFRKVGLTDKKSISVETIRDEVISFMALRTTGHAPISRIVVIENAELMTTQAQNALLKTIEEPPANTVLILTATTELAILPTIRSRVQQVTVQQPLPDQLTSFFADNGYPEGKISRAVLVSGCLPGLAHALLSEDESHPLVQASAIARALLQESAFERLLRVDDLASDRQRWLDTLFMLGRMASVAMQKDGASGSVIRKWQKVLSACHEAEKQTLGSAQIKLVILNFMLSL